MTPERGVVILHGPTWDGASQVSKHHLARHWAAKGRRVLYVEAPFHPLSLMTRPAESRRLWGRFVDEPERVEPNLWVQAYPALYPFRAGWPWASSRLMLRVNLEVARRWLPDLCRRLGLRRPLVLVGSPVAGDLLERLTPDLVVYHCSDDYARQPTFPDGFANLETELMARSDLVICTAEALRQAKAGMHRNCHTVVNGVQVGHFARTQLPETASAPDLSDLPRPVVGYIGTVFEWLDQPMIANAARVHRDWSFVFVGPITTDVKLLRELPNIHFLGPRPYLDLLGYLKGFDVATVPFIFHDVTLRASPIKFYEYLASGVPIVASRLPDFEPLAHLTELVSNPSEFVLALENAVEHDSPAKRTRRMTEARNHSWETRFAEIDRLIRAAVDRKRSEERVVAEQ